MERDAAGAALSEWRVIQTEHLKRWRGQIREMATNQPGDSLSIGGTDGTGHIPMEFMNGMCHIAVFRAVPSDESRQQMPHIKLT